jgi:hypothetical protein
MNKKEVGFIVQFFFWFVPLLVGAVAVTGASYLVGSLSIGAAAVIFLVGFLCSMPLLVWFLGADHTTSDSDDKN